jgi:signal transduction histidine kinase
MFLGLVAAGLVVADAVWYEGNAQHADNIVLVLYLIAAEVLLGRTAVRIERGRLTLSALALGPAAILLDPINASIVGLSLGVTIRGGGRWRIVTNAVLSAAYTGFGALITRTMFHGSDVPALGRLLITAVTWLIGWALLSTYFSLRTGEYISSIVRHNFTVAFYAAFGYFTLGSVLTSYLLDGTLRGYLLSAIVFVLALALTDTIAGRRVRRVLESELSDADRHLFHSRAVEGVVHNLRNHLATAVGYLKEIDTNRLEPVERDAVETAKAATNDAVTVLRSLAQGATPRVTYSKEAVDLNELAARALDMSRPRARARHIELALRQTPDEIKVRADPLLLREVATNLVNNAIDAAPENGRVEVSTGRRSNGSPYFSVTDNGSGVADENRHHLFEPHFTTKEHGTGLGLFMSYGIVREHQGQLLYEGNRKGAVFTVVLPSFSG